MGAVITKEAGSDDVPGVGGVAVVAYVYCAHCRKHFRSPMQFATVAQFERAAGLGLIAQCPGCYRIFDCNRGNMHCEVSASGPATDDR